MQRFLNAKLTQLEQHKGSKPDHVVLRSLDADLSCQMRVMALFQKFDVKTFATEDFVNATVEVFQGNPLQLCAMLYSFCGGRDAGDLGDTEFKDYYLSCLDSATFTAFLQSNEHATDDVHRRFAAEMRAINAAHQ